MNPIRFLPSLLRCGCFALLVTVAHAQFTAGSFVSTPATTATSPLNLTVGQTYASALTFTITPQAGSTIATTQIRGGFPTGLTAGGTAGPVFYVVNGPTVTFSGIPTRIGDYHLVVNAVTTTGIDSLSQGISWDIYFHVAAAPIPPQILAQPESYAAAIGGSAVFTVSAIGDAPLSYQWRKDGTAIAGATGSSLVLTGVTTANAGAYSVVVTNAVGSATSASATLTVSASAAPTFTRQPIGLTVNAGGTVALSATVAGTPTPTLQWQKNGVDVAGAVGPVLTLSNVSAADAGDYTLVATNTAGTATSFTATLIVTNAQVSRISNLSVRTNLAAGQTLTVGFVTSGPKTLLLRAVGPTLKTVFSLQNFFTDPKLAVKQNGVTIDQNDNWSSSLSPTFVSVGAFPLDAASADAALTRSINGPTTAEINGTGSGVTLVEVYDAQNGSSARLTNVSARNKVGTGADILISGFVIDGTAARTLLIRGIGPALQDVFGIAGVLADPVLEIHTTVNGQDTVVASNDNWNGSLAPVFASVGAYAFTSGSKDAAILITLPPGVYTAQVAGANNGTGDGVVEVYEVP